MAEVVYESRTALLVGHVLAAGLELYEGLNTKKAHRKLNICERAIRKLTPDARNNGTSSD